MNHLPLFLAAALLLAAVPATAQETHYYNADNARQPHARAAAPAATEPTPDAPADTSAGTSAGAGDDAGEDGEADDSAQEVQILPAHSAVVTSIDTCLDQLDPDDAAEVRSNVLTPYRDCQDRLSNKKAAKKTAKAGKRKNPPEAENARNFVRVKPPKDDDDDAPPAKKAKAAPADDDDNGDKDGGEKLQSGSWSSSVKPDKSKPKLNP